jgi:hypothetical protein
MIQIWNEENISVTAQFMFTKDFYLKICLN